MGSILLLTCRVTSLPAQTQDVGPQPVSSEEVELGLMTEEELEVSAKLGSRSWMSCWET